MIAATPILLPFLAMIVLLITGKNRLTLHKIVALLTTLLLVTSAVALFINVQQDGIRVVFAGGWKAPLGISLVIDSFSAIMVLVTSLVALSMVIYAFRGLDKNRLRSRYFVFFFCMIMGINGAFITGDIFNMYVWFEVLLMASFILMVLGNERKQLEGGLKYLAINLVGSLIFLTGIGILYGHAGTLNLAHRLQHFGYMPLYWQTTSFL